MPEKEDHHALALGLGGMLFSAGCAGLIALLIWAAGSPNLHLWANPWFDAVIVILCLMVLVGIYAASSPWTGLPMPAPRMSSLRQRSAQGRSGVTNERALTGPNTRTLLALRQIRSELSHAHERIQQSIQNGTYWPRLEESQLSVKIWQQNRPRLQETPGLGQLPHRLDVAYGEVRRVNDIKVSRVLKGNRVEDSDRLSDALVATHQAIILLDQRIESLDQELTGH